MRIFSIILLGRLVTGIGASNFTVCLAAVADITGGTGMRGRYLSLGSMCAGLIFILGPFVGGKFSDVTEYSWASFDLPMWMGGILSLINAVCIPFLFKETLPVTKKCSLKRWKLDNTLEIFRKRNVSVIYSILFLYFFGWNLIYQFTPAYLLQRFSMTNSQIGNSISLMGVFWIIGSGVFFQLERKFLSTKNILILSLTSMGVLSLCVGFASRIWDLVFIIGFTVSFAGIIWPTCIIAISHIAGENMQGKMLGITQSVQSLATLLAPLIGGTLLFISPSINYLMAALFSLSAVFLATRIKKEEY